VSKPDWAERLQRTFQRRFEAGVKSERQRIVKLLEAHASKEYGFGIEHELIELITGEIKCYCVGTWQCPICKEKNK
jgi:hypothetical protein